MKHITLLILLTTNVFAASSAIQSGVGGGSGPYGNWGFEGTNCSWTTSSATYADYSVDTTCTFTQQFNSGMGTVVKEATGLPGITLTAPQTGTLKVCVIYSGMNNSADYNGYKLVEAAGPTQLAKGTSVGSENGESVMCGFHSVTAASSYTFKIQGLGRSGTTNRINDGVGADTWPLQFYVEYK